jgi:hypothetical protein
MTLPPNAANPRGDGGKEEKKGTPLRAEGGLFLHHKRREEPRSANNYYIINALI